MTGPLKRKYGYISYGEVVVHFRCKICGRIQPAIRLNSDDLSDIAERQDAKDLYATCDNCFKEERKAWRR